MITDIIIIPPDEVIDEKNHEQMKRKMKFATSGRDGKVKIWNGHTMINEQTIEVVKEAESN